MAAHGRAVLRALGEVRGSGLPWATSVVFRIGGARWSGEARSLVRVPLAPGASKTGLCTYLQKTVNYVPLCKPEAGPSDRQAAAKLCLHRRLRFYFNKYS